MIISRGVGSSEASACNALATLERHYRTGKMANGFGRVGRRPWGVSLGLEAPRSQSRLANLEAPRSRTTLANLEAPASRSTLANLEAPRSWSTLANLEAPRSRSKPARKSK